MSTTTRTGTARRWLALGVVLALALTPVAAMAHGTSGAVAKQPKFNSATQRLSGGGGFGTSRKHSELRIRVCLEKLYGERYFAVRCKNKSRSTARAVTTRVSVPGCVDGVWRTVVSGEAVGRDGTVKHQASRVSPRFRC